MRGHQSVSHHFTLSCRKWDSLADQYYIPSVQWINKYTQRITHRGNCTWAWYSAGALSVGDGGHTHPQISRITSDDTSAKASLLTVWAKTGGDMNANAGTLQCLTNRNAAVQPPHEREVCCALIHFHRVVWKDSWRGRWELWITVRKMVSYLKV